MDPSMVSFIILSFNRKDALMKAVAGAARQRYANKEIVVVDNGSTDGTVALLAQTSPETRVVALPENVGAPAARNRGVEAARGGVLVFLDDDCVLDGDSAAELVVRHFEADPACGAVAFQILDPRTHGDWPYGLYDGSDCPMAFECALFRSGGVAIRRAVLTEVGGFWEPFFIVHEDTELALRMIVSGWKIVGRRDIVTWHPAPDPAAPPNPRREIYFKVRNTIWLSAKSMPVSLIPSFLLPTLARSMNLAVRTGRMTLLIRAVVDGLRGMSRCLRERRPVSTAWVRRARTLHMRLWS